MELQTLLTATVEAGASDLFLKTGAPPAFRVDGLLRRDILPKEQRAEVVAADFMTQAVATVLDEDDQKAFHSEGEADAAYEVPELGRFRVNAFRQRGQAGLVFRFLLKTIPSLEDLNLPVSPLQSLCSRRRGLVLVTGVAGSGKSTCLAAMVDYINSTFRRHIVTIEDPIEYVYQDKRSLIEQREIGRDTHSFTAALKHCVRQSPDVILIGEMRDAETMEAALSAAETGHLVFSTLHTVNAVQTVERIMGYFPPYLHPLIRLELAMVLEGVVSLRLLRRSGEAGRLPAVELLMATPTTRDLLQQGRTRQLPAALRDGAYYGAQTFGQSLKHLMDEGLISEEEALAAADNPEDLKLELKGITRSVDTRPQRPSGPADEEAPQS
ncbi:MAG: PilT/PilU family type 4a pilus ATPase [Candidatus Brocadiia bacterium]|jgi:twitching motility protein PilT